MKIEVFFFFSFFFIIIKSLPNSYPALLSPLLPRCSSLKYFLPPLLCLNFTLNYNNPRVSNDFWRSLTVFFVSFLEKCFFFFFLFNFNMRKVLPIASATLFPKIVHSALKNRFLFPRFLFIFLSIQLILVILSKLSFRSKINWWSNKLAVKK